MKPRPKCLPYRPYLLKKLRNHEDALYYLKASLDDSEEQFLHGLKNVAQAVVGQFPFPQAYDAKAGGN